MTTCALPTCTAEIHEDANARRVYCTDAHRARAHRERRAEGIALMTASTEAMHRGDVAEWRLLSEAGLAVLRSTPRKPLSPEILALIAQLEGRA
ncbi:hypothetical protein FHX52_1047 [Humibacillus xanthopallidus]|uniref:Uncharacterized protein n=1 Tax=Humibacillus xanthopallidus TaxID=412689 RepID=A0A543PV26_9MICO|nr:hypothetical protein [Humibacillus xanthopallidus]TQN47928.1 hypothetical protein FHX52_1047 [Humibacillus xanthopallidus]